MLTTHQSEAEAIRYLVARDALHKLKTPVPLLLSGNPHHSEALRRRRKAGAGSRRSRFMVAWAIPFPLLGSLIRF